MEKMETNSDNFENDDPEIIDTDFFKLQHELSCLQVKTQVSKMFLEEQKKYLQVLQKSFKNSDGSSSEEDEMGDTLLSMQNNLQKLYEEFLSMPNRSDAHNDLVLLVENTESSFHTRGLEFEENLESFEMIFEKQGNSEELERLNQMQANLDAEAKKLEFLLVEKEQLKKQFAENEAVDMKELQKMIIELALEAKKHEEQRQEENIIIKKMENELLMLEAKEKALINHEEDYLNDNGIIQVELCEDKIPQFESIFKDPNDFPYLSSLKKIEDEKISSNDNKRTPLKTGVVSKPPVLQDKNDEIKSKEKLQNVSNKQNCKGEQSPTNSPKNPFEILKMTKIPVEKILKTPKNSKIAPRIPEVSIIDKLPAKKSRKRSVVEVPQDIHNVMQQVQEPVQKSPKTTIKPIIISSSRVSVDSPVTTRKLKSISSSRVSVDSPVAKSMSSPRVSVDSPVTIRKLKSISSSRVSVDSPVAKSMSSPRVSVDSPVTIRKLKSISSPRVSVDTPATTESPSKKAKIIGVEILSYPILKTILTDTKPRLLSQEIIDPSIKEGSEIKQTLLENVESKKTSEETKVVIKSPKDSPIWKSPHQKKDNKAQTLIVDEAQSITDFSSETSDIEHIFDFEICSIKSGTRSEFNFSPSNSTKSFNMDTSENDDAKGTRKSAFDFDSFSDSKDFAGGLF